MYCTYREAASPFANPAWHTVSIVLIPAVCSDEKQSHVHSEAILELNYEVLLAISGRLIWLRLAEYCFTLGEVFDRPECAVLLERFDPVLADVVVALYSSGKWYSLFLPAKGKTLTFYRRYMIVMLGFRVDITTPDSWHKIFTSVELSRLTERWFAPILSFSVRTTAKLLKSRFTAIVRWVVRYVDLATVNNLLGCDVTAIPLRGDGYAVIQYFYLCSQKNCITSVNLGKILEERHYYYCTVAYNYPPIALANVAACPTVVLWLRENCRILEECEQTFGLKDH